MESQSIKQESQVPPVCLGSIPAVFELSCQVLHNVWGKTGLDSQVARLKCESDPTYKIDQNEHYAQMCMGTHPNFPSMAKIPNGGEIPLIQLVKQHWEILGFGSQYLPEDGLPFLFKVLSVKSALALQAHPDKELACYLRQKFPEVYQDSNHKPEMAIALTPFSGLCGFRPIGELATFLQFISELHDAVGDDAADKVILASQTCNASLQAEAMRECFRSLMTRDESEISPCLSALVGRVKMRECQKQSIQEYEGKTLLKIDREYPGDRGAFAIYFLNIIRLQQGEAIYIDSNVPHAYLSGDCIECMACSDNVIRGAFSHKLKDVETLCRMLDYNPRSVTLRGMAEDSKSNNIKITKFSPALAEFGVSKYEIAKEEKNATLPALNSASICLIVSGEGEATHASCIESLRFRSGTVLFICPNVEIDLQLNNCSCIMYRAHPGDL